MVLIKGIIKIQGNQLKVTNFTQKNNKSINWAFGINKMYPKAQLQIFGYYSNCNPTFIKLLIILLYHHFGVKCKF